MDAYIRTSFSRIYDLPNASLDRAHGCLHTDFPPPFLLLCRHAIRCIIYVYIYIYIYMLTYSTRARHAQTEPSFSIYDVYCARDDIAELIHGGLLDENPLKKVRRIPTVVVLHANVRFHIYIYIYIYIYIEWYVDRWAGRCINTWSHVQVLIGRVPDRGGRVDEITNSTMKMEVYRYVTSQVFFFVWRYILNRIYKIPKQIVKLNTWLYAKHHFYVHSFQKWRVYRVRQLT